MPVPRPIAYFWRKIEGNVYFWMAGIVAIGMGAILKVFLKWFETAPVIEVLLVFVLILIVGATVATFVTEALKKSSPETQPGLILPPNYLRGSRHTASTFGKAILMGFAVLIIFGSFLYYFRTQVESLASNHRADQFVFSGSVYGGNNQFGNSNTMIVTNGPEIFKATITQIGAVTNQIQGGKYISGVELRILSPFPVKMLYVQALGTNIEASSAEPINRDGATWVQKERGRIAGGAGLYVKFFEAKGDYRIGFRCTTSESPKITWRVE